MHQVSEVKQVIKEEMIAARQAIVYSEPERQVMSRSGDMCVVALTDQWYINYGEDEWREATRHVTVLCCHLEPGFKCSGFKDGCMACKSACCQNQIVLNKTVFEPAVICTCSSRPAI